MERKQPELSDITFVFIFFSGSRNKYRYPGKEVWSEYGMDVNTFGGAKRTLELCRRSASASERFTGVEGWKVSVENLKYPIFIFEKTLYCKSTLASELK